MFGCGTHLKLRKRVNVRNPLGFTWGYKPLVFHAFSGGCCAMSLFASLIESTQLVADWDSREFVRRDIRLHETRYATVRHQWLLPVSLAFSLSSFLTYVLAFYCGGVRTNQTYTAISQSTPTQWPKDLSTASWLLLLQSTIFFSFSSFPFLFLFNPLFVLMSVDNPRWFLGSVTSV